MGRKCLAQKQPPHDLINNTPTVAPKGRTAAPQLGYADFARGGALHQASPLLGLGPTSAASQAQHQAGVESRARPRGGGSWTEQPGWSLKVQY